MKKRMVLSSDITDEGMLIELLNKMEYVSRKVDFTENKILREKSGFFQNEPRRWLVAQDNKGVDSHALVTTEKGSFYIYCYDAGNDLYRIWEIIADEVDEFELKRIIKIAMTKDELVKRFDYLG